MKRTIFQAISACAAALLFPWIALGDGSLTSINVSPPNVNLTTKLGRQSFIVTANRSDGVTVDVTKQATVKLADAKLARLENATLYPVADGQTMMEVDYQGLKASVPVVVKDALADRPISFHLDVMPVFMRSGCNTGNCHGAARGKDGFRLSLFGFDPKGDYLRLTREVGARRINLAVPQDSLLIEKCTGAVPHTGGKRFAADSELNKTLLRWLEAGAPQDATEPPRVVKLELFPNTAVIEGADTTQQFIARAIYADGTDRDVTSLVTFMTTNDNSAPINSDGLVTAAARGEAFIMARYETHTVGSQVLVLPKDLKYSPPKITGDYVDQLVGAKLNNIRMLPSEVCTDEQFLRRVTIDIAGMMPTEQEYHAFMSSNDPQKRAKLVDELLERKEFAEIWAMKWSELLIVKSNNNTISPKSAYLYSNWLTDKIANNVPINKMIEEILSASGGTFTNPGTNYFQLERDTLKTAENVAQQFMGLRTQCAQCHNHPFDRWTMDDYYSFAAFFSQVGRKPAEDYREIIVYNTNSGDVRHLVGGRVMKPKFLGGIEPDVTGVDRRAVLAKWLTSNENTLFSRSIANRVWSHFFGKGIVDPVDDVRVSNPPSNPALFDKLGDKLVEYNFDFKHLVRDICNSQTYQRATDRNESNKDDERNFAHGNVRRVQAEMLLDCITQVTNTQDKFARLPLGARAVQIADGATSNYFLTTFGRAKRETVCAAEVQIEPTLSQALHMINGDTVQGKISRGNIVKSMLDEKKKPEEVIASIYIRTLCRTPTPNEVQQLMTIVGQAENPRAGLEDVLWAVLNSREFIFNH